MDYENVTPVENIGTWYQLFKGDNVVAAEEGKPAAASNVVGELLIDAIKLREYANFITQFATSIEQDIRTDIITDIVPVVAPPIGDMASPVSPVPAIQPLKLAADRRGLAVKYAGELTTLVNAIDGILARVKFKEQQ